LSTTRHTLFVAGLIASRSLAAFLASFKLAVGHQIVAVIEVAFLFGEGFSVVTIKSDGDAQIDLTPRTTRFPACGSCQKPCSTTHEYCERVVRDLRCLERLLHDLHTTLRN
jgi:hypothetical protein